MKLFFLLSFGILLSLVSCNNSVENNSENIVVAYQSEALHQKEIEKFCPQNLSKEDSLNWVKDFKRQWLKNQIIIGKAEKELPKYEKDISLELLQYKADLLKFRYENYYIKNKINTQISNSEIEDYYTENKSRLLLQEDLVKAIYIEIPNTVKNRYRVKQWLVSKREKDEDKLKVFCFQNATVFDDFDGNWIKLKQLKLITQSDKLQSNRIVENKVIEQRDKQSTHYVLISEWIKKGEIMPLNYAKPEIIKIIRNKRKSQLLEVLNQKITDQVNEQLKKK